MSEEALRHGPLDHTCMHLCVDMQGMFAEKTDWHTPWMLRALPNVRRIVAAQPDRTVFTRFIPAERPGQGRGTWARYYDRWASMTKAELDPALIELVPELLSFARDGHVFDKTVYSPWPETSLDAWLQGRDTSTLIVTGGETDVCVLATVLGAVDLGYRIVVVTDAICSSSDAAHDALLTLYRSRYGQQVETVTTDVVLRSWNP
ncbi:MAG: cysteine hydrolase [Methylobacterium sp.]|uniref:cysteine hydrolase family protein n=1 Tax=Methylobacterium sp. TaxID=409 RepID=UPI0025E45C46|nr:isochorismatase family cysteine hydrolase [Methylobacterium sp.]MBX9932120.1 cysteine hydrolase [Methylobacterium sp.]